MIDIPSVQPYQKELLEAVQQIKSEKLKIVDRLGSGQFGTVYKAECDGEMMAVKYLNVIASSDTEEIMEALQEFYKEVKVMSLLRHENLLGCKAAVIEWPSRVGIVMEFMVH